jgi:hypothetical protein
MLRKLALALVILAMAAVPAHALVRDIAHEGRHEIHGGDHQRHVRFEHRSRGFVSVYPYYPYTPSTCYWQPGYWANAPYVDAWGRYTYVTQWVPAQYVCY